MLVVVFSCGLELQPNHVTLITEFNEQRVLDYEEGYTT